MPTYDYACRLCGHRFEHFAPMSAEPLRRCPGCGQDGLERLIGPGAGILFKGSGFYETDYKRPAPAGKDKDAGGGEGQPAGSGTPKADAPAGGSGSQAAKPAPGSAAKDSKPA